MHDQNFVPTKYEDIVGRIFVTAYLGTTNSSSDTQSRAKRLSEGIGALHYDMNIDTAYTAMVGVFKQATGKHPKYES